MRFGWQASVVTKMIPVVLMTAASSLALAQEKGYSQVSYMRMDMEVSGGGSSEEASPDSVQLLLGTNLVDYFGIEGVFGFGVTDDDFVDGVSGKLNTLFGVNGVATLPVAKKADFYAKLGFAQMDLEVADESYDDAGIMYGLGFAIRTSRYGAVALEYMRLPDVDLDAGATAETSAINLGYRIRY